MWGSNPFEIRHNRFFQNAIYGETGRGGGLYAATPTLYEPMAVTNNVFTENIAPTAGGAYLFSDTAPLLLTNNTSTGNQSGDSQGDITQLGFFAEISNNILYMSGNGSNDLKASGGGGVSFFNNDVRHYVFDYPPGFTNNNIDADPKLIGYHIAHSDQDPSPVVDAGENNAQGIPEEDIDGDPRILGTAIDMGADEFNPIFPYVWVNTESIVSPNGIGDGFGYSVALDGDTLVVGAPFTDIGTYEQAGTAYIYVRNHDGMNPNVWQLRQILVPSNPGYPLYKLRFGWSTAIKGDFIIVGSEKEDSLNSYTNSQIYRRTPSGDWVLDGEVAGGYSVDIGYPWAVTGSPYAGFAPFEYGEASVYRREGINSCVDDNCWVLKDKVFPFDGWTPAGVPDHGEFGKTVKLTAGSEGFGTVLIGAPNVGYVLFYDPWYALDPYTSGAIYTFKLDPSIAAVAFEDQLHLEKRMYIKNFGKALGFQHSGYQFLPGFTAASDHLLFHYQREVTGGAFWELASGSAAIYSPHEIESVSRDGQWVVAGIPNDDGCAGLVEISYQNTSPLAGTAYDWQVLQKIYDTRYVNCTFEDALNFGHSTAISGNTIAVGAPWSGVSGAVASVFIYEFPNPPVDPPAGYVKDKYYPGLIIDGTVENNHWYDFESDGQDMMAMLAFGSTFKLSAYGPGDDLEGNPRIATDALSTSPIELPIHAAEVGHWKFKVTSIESKNDNPYTFAILLADHDEDGIPDGRDNCPAVANPDQLDSDGNGIGDACETGGDADGDGVPDEQDNCPGVANPDQADSDGDGIGDACQSVVDITPPAISLSVSPTTLWPPNHKMVNITVSVSAADDLDPEPTVVLTSITASEGDDGLGDGSTVNDILVKENGDIYLRAERSGKNSDRIYTLTYTASDASGNTAIASATVTVPHNK
jgi:hypothetical protein